MTSPWVGAHQKFDIFGQKWQFLHDSKNSSQKNYNVALLLPWSIKPDESKVLRRISTLRICANGAAIQKWYSQNFQFMFFVTYSPVKNFDEKP